MVVRLAVQKSQVLFASSATLTESYFSSLSLKTFKTGDKLEEEQKLIQEEHSKFQVKTVVDWILQIFQRQTLSS